MHHASLCAPLPLCEQDDGFQLVGRRQRCQQQRRISNQVELPVSDVVNRPFADVDDHNDDDDDDDVDDNSCQLDFWDFYSMRKTPGAWNVRLVQKFEKGKKKTKDICGSLSSDPSSSSSSSSHKTTTTAVYGNNHKLMKKRVKVWSPKNTVTSALSADSQLLAAETEDVKGQLRNS